MLESKGSVDITHTEEIAKEIPVEKSSDKVVLLILQGIILIPGFSPELIEIQSRAVFAFNLVKDQTLQHFYLHSILTTSKGNEHK